MTGSAFTPTDAEIDRLCAPILGRMAVAAGAAERAFRSIDTSPQADARMAAALAKLRGDGPPSPQPGA